MSWSSSQQMQPKIWEARVHSYHLSQTGWIWFSSFQESCQELRKRQMHFKQWGKIHQLQQRHAIWHVHYERRETGNSLEWGSLYQQLQVHGFLTWQIGNLTDCGKCKACRHGKYIKKYVNDDGKMVQ